MEQTIINCFVGAFGFVLAFLLKVIWDGMRNCQVDIAAVRLLMADSYIKKADFDKLTSDIRETLRRIEDKIDHKADKSP